MINQLKQMPDVVEQMLAQEEKMAEFAKLLTNQKMPTLLVDNWII